MAVRSVSSSNAQFTTGLGVGVKSLTPDAGVPWVRNKSWLTFTAPTASEEKFIGLHAVWPESNFLALTAAGNYTVDWGDGVVENFSSGVTAEHEYNFADTDLANTNAPVTFQGGADTVTRSSHGYANGDVVEFFNIVTTTGISAGTPYYVIDAATNTFKVSLTAGGSAVDLVSDGSATLLPYKQAIVQVYPQAGQNLTALNLSVRHSSLSTIQYCSGFLDIAVAGASLTDFRVATSPIPSSVQLSFSFLEQVNLVRTDCRQLSSLFFSCYALQSVVNLATSTAPAASIPVTFTDSTDTVNATSHGFRNGDTVYFASVTSTTGVTANSSYFVINATSNTFQVSLAYGGTAVALTTDGSGVAVRGTDMSSLFNTCGALNSVPFFDTSAVISMAGMFSSCTSLKTVPLYNTSNVRNMSSMFSFSGVRSVPLFNTASVTNMSFMFNTASAIKTVPLFNTASVTNMSFMFNSCTSIESVPPFNSGSATTTVRMFRFCSNLKTVSLFNTASVTDMTLMFDGCSALESVPLFNTASVTFMVNMFSNCRSLKTVPLFNTASVTSMAAMFSGCSSLESVPLFNTASVTIMTQMFNNCVQLRSVPLFNTASVTNMTTLFSNCWALETVPLFNTASVTTMSSMFSACYGLKVVPLFNTASVTDMSSMFSNCNSLESVPLFNTASVTSMNSTFIVSRSLKTVPLFNTAAVTDFRNMFQGAQALQSVPALNVTAVSSSTNFGNMFGSCANLSRIQAEDFRFTFSVASCKLSATALNEIYTNLPTVVGQTITVTGNYGTAGDDPSIATAKGWTVTG